MDDEEQQYIGTNADAWRESDPEKLIRNDSGLLGFLWDDSRNEPKQPDWDRYFGLALAGDPAATRETTAMLRTTLDRLAERHDQIVVLHEKAREQVSRLAAGLAGVNPDGLPSASEASGLALVQLAAQQQEGGDPRLRDAIEWARECDLFRDVLLARLEEVRALLARLDSQEKGVPDPSSLSETNRAWLRAYLAVSRQDPGNHKNETQWHMAVTDAWVEDQMATVDDVVDDYERERRQAKIEKTDWRASRMALTRMRFRREGDTAANYLAIRRRIEEYAANAERCSLL